MFCVIQELLEQETSISGLQPEEGGQMLCIQSGAMAGLSGGALGYVFGFGKVLNIAAVMPSTTDTSQGHPPCLSIQD